MNKRQRHLGKVAALGCCVCSEPGTPAEIHHIGDSSERSDFLTIPLCPIHHRLGGMGVAYHAGPKAFERQHGSEIQLLAKVNEALA